jgi:hypothetical protein
MLEIHLAGKNHQEEAKLQHLHTPSLHTASPLHIKQRNKEGSCAAGRQCLNCLGRCRPPGELSSMRYSTNNPGPDQHSPLDRPTPTQGKKWEKKLNNNQPAEKEKKKRHVAKRAGHPELRRLGEGQSLMEQ